MNAEAQRVAIAEACGWRAISQPPYDLVLLNPDGFQMAWGVKNGRTDEELRADFAYNLPDYLNSLDAMHGAEKVIEEKCLCVEYVNTLHDFAIYPKTLSRYGLTHATAAQRAEAFLRTIGKWSENPA